MSSEASHRNTQPEQSNAVDSISSPYTSDTRPRFTNDEFNQGIDAIAVGGTEDERIELARHQIDSELDARRQRLLEETTGKFAWLKRIPGIIKISWSKNFERFRLYNEYSTQDMAKLLKSEEEVYREIATRRAQQLELDLNAKDQNSQLRGYEELQHRETREYAGGLKELGDLIKDFVLNTDESSHSKEKFYERKNKIVESMVIGQSDDVVRAAKDKADTLWVRVEERRKRVEGLNDRDEVINKMNFNVLLRFGRARLTSETPEEQTATIRFESLLLKSEFLNKYLLKFRKRHWAQAIIFSASLLPLAATRHSMRILAVPGLSFIAAGAFEYARKRDEIDGTNSRVTRMLARGEDISKLPNELNVPEFLSTISGNQKDVIGILNTLEVQESNPQETDNMEKTYAEFYARHSLSREKNVDLFTGASHVEIQSSRSKLLDRYYTYQRTLDSSGKERLEALVRDERTKINSEIETNRRLFESLRRSRSLKSAVKKGAFAGIISLGATIGAITHDQLSYDSTILSKKLEQAKIFIEKLSMNGIGKHFGLTKMEVPDTVPPKPPYFLPPIEEDTPDSSYVPDKGLGSPLEKVSNPSLKTFEEEYEIMPERTINLTGQDALDKLLTIDEEHVLKPEGYDPVSTAAEQNERFGALTRSNWKESENLSIVGRKYDPTDTRYFGKELMDLTGTYDDEPLKIWVRFLDSEGNLHVIDATHLMEKSSDAHDGLNGYEVDFSKDTGIIGKIWANGGNTHEGFLRQIKDIQYGFALDSNGNRITDMKDMTSLQNVATITGGGEVPDLTYEETIPPVMGVRKGFDVVPGYTYRPVAPTPSEIPQKPSLPSLPSTKPIPSLPSLPSTTPTPSIPSLPDQNERGSN